MTITRLIQFDRSDLSEQHRSEPFESVSLDHFNRDDFDQVYIKNAKMIVFTDGKRSKILQSVYAV